MKPLYWVGLGIVAGSHLAMIVPDAIPAEYEDDFKQVHPYANLLAVGLILTNQ